MYVKITIIRMMKTTSIMMNVEFKNLKFKNLMCFFDPAALQALKRKKRFQKQLQQVDGMLSTIDFQLDALGKCDNKH